MFNYPYKKTNCNGDIIQFVIIMYKMNNIQVWVFSIQKFIYNFKYYEFIWVLNAITNLRNFKRKEIIEKLSHLEIFCF